MRNVFIYLVIMTGVLACNQQQTQDSKVESSEEVNPARKVIEKVVKKVGSMNDLNVLKDVEYTYSLNAVSRNIKNVSKERYLFNGELSWAQYLPAEQFPIKEDTITQGYDGDSVWVRVNGMLSNEISKVQFASFIRKTNFYWFTMMQKLLDEGVRHRLLPSRTVDSTEYKIVEMTFDANIGEVQDKYVLYVNPSTDLIDQFLFTVKELDLAPIDPLLMEVDYESFEGVKLMTRRIVRVSNWDGKSDGEIIYDQQCIDVKFNNGFPRSLFEK